MDSQRQPARQEQLGAVRVKCFAQGHINTQLGGAGDRTSNLSGYKITARPPELSRLILPRHLISNFFCWVVNSLVSLLFMAD